MLESLALVRTFHQQLKQYQVKVKAQRDVDRLMKLRVENKLNNKLDELTTELSVLIANNQELDALENVIEAILSLIKSIGGGYDVCYEG